MAMILPTANATLPIRRSTLRGRVRIGAGSAGAAAVQVAPGVALCVAVAAVATLLAIGERRVLGAAWLEPLVLAIVVGAAVRSRWEPRAAWRPGIEFSARRLLEVAVVLLGASLGARTVLAIGPAMLGGIATIVAVAIGGSYGIGRLCGLERRMAVLVACGNAICGNSAIAAVAPVIGAEGEDVSAAISFTAVLGVALVLLLPVLAPVLRLTVGQYGALAGLTVYAVPQVLAAAAPLGPAALQLGMVVKLVRVLMLGPVVLLLALLASPRTGVPGRAGFRRPPVHRLLPWFIVGFLLLAAARTGGLLPDGLLRIAAALATLLTVVSMAGLGLSTDLAAAARAGGRVSAVVVLSLLLLGALSLVLVRCLHPG